MIRFYEDPRHTSENRLPQRAFYIPEGAASLQTLNGNWRFAYCENSDFFTEPQKWDTITVPSCWQLFGYDSPNYSNYLYPYPADPPYVPDVNPMGVYERTFTIDKGGKWYLVMEGVSSCAVVWVNGQRVGFTQGSHLQAEFDLTAYVHSGDNTIRVVVYKWCCGSYLEDQDFLRYNGIFRDIYLLNRPEGHIGDLEVIAKDETVTVRTDRAFSATLADREGNMIATGEGERELALTVPSPVLWNAERPYLYELTVTCAGEIIRQKVGFRTIAISDKLELLINGAPVKLKGVNHHDSNGNKGWCMSDEEVRKDLELIKSLHMNAVRTSHYPPSPRFLEYCDELGLYVVLETDIETHGMCTRFASGTGYDMAPEWPACDPAWEAEFVNRMYRALERDKNHASIIMWSTGNESGHGPNHVSMINWVRERDNSRLIHCEDASRAEKNDRADVYSWMYPSLEKIESYVQDDVHTQPIFMCEYAHAMGNGPGDVWDYWEKIYEHPQLIGGCVWEWCDHVVVDEKGVARYGGDFPNEPTHDYNFCCDGMVTYDRQFKAGTLEIRAAYTPFRLSYSDGALLVTNRYDFTNLSEREFVVTIACDGKVLRKETVCVTASPSETVCLLDNIVLPESCTLGCTVDVEMLGGSGKAVLQLELPCPVRAPEKAPAAAAEFSEDEQYCYFSGKRFTYRFSKQLGHFDSMVVDGVEQLAAPVELTVMRALIDNDAPMKPLWTRVNIWDGENFELLCSRVYATEICENAILVTASLAGMSRQPFFHYTQRVAVDAEGTITVTLDGKIRENCVWLPRLGYEFTFRKENMAFDYFGYGPTESYCDLYHSARLDWHSSTAKAEYVPYVRPQDHGNHTGTRVLKLENGFAFQADRFIDVQVSAFTGEAVNKAEHTDELIADGYTHVRVDYKDSGVGSGACGPVLEPPYRLSDKDIHFTASCSITG
ncbi:MAG: glycoside hydrolase family 2 [Clostridia bacterium]|nr:glycoside hydrolase family 2 [Clostridia bacterium]